MQRTRANSEATRARSARGIERGWRRVEGASPGHGAIGLDAVLEAVELPAGVADLDPGLADVDAYDLSHRARCGRLLRRLAWPRCGFLPWGLG